MTHEIASAARSKMLRWALYFIGGIALILVVFQLGMFVGFRKARFSFRWADSYHRTFGGPRGGWWQDFTGDDLINGHGVAGQVIKIDGNSLVIKGKEAVERIVVVSASTTIRGGRDTMSASDIKVDTKVVVIGTPQTDGSIMAKLIRVFDSNLPMIRSRHSGFRFFR